MHTRWSCAVNARCLRASFSKQYALFSRAYSQTPPTILPRQVEIDPMTGEPMAPLDIEVGSSLVTAVSPVINISVYGSLLGFKSSKLRILNRHRLSRAWCLGVHSYVHPRMIYSWYRLFLADRPHVNHPMVFKVWLVHTIDPTLFVVFHSLVSIVSVN